MVCPNMESKKKSLGLKQELERRVAALVMLASCWGRQGEAGDVDVVNDLKAPMPMSMTRDQEIQVSQTPIRTYSADGGTLISITYTSSKEQRAATILSQPSMRSARRLELH